MTQLKRSPERFVVLMVIAVIGAACSTDAATHSIGTESSPDTDSVGTGPETTVDEQPATFEDRVWEHRVDISFMDPGCEPGLFVEILDDSYVGPLVDTHFHMPHIPDSRPGAEEGEQDLEGFGEGSFREHGLIVYLHPGQGHEESLAAALEANPDTTFVVHGDEIEQGVGQLMDAYPNIYYTIDAIYGDQYLLRPEEDTKSFLAATEDFGPLLLADWAKWRDVIEAHPDRFMWGTDRGGSAVWTTELAVGHRLVAYGRAFIRGLDPEIQSLVAHENARRIIESAGRG